MSNNNGQQGDIDLWLDPGNEDVDALMAILECQIHTDLVSMPVSSRINSVQNNSPDNIIPNPEA